MHVPKSKMIRFKQPSKFKAASGNGTFDFLGFTHYWGRSRKGFWVIKRQTMRKRQVRAMKNLYYYCRNNRHDPVAVQHAKLTQKMRGIYNYYGIIGNYRALWTIHQNVKKYWRRWLGRRTRNGYISWDKFADFLMGWPLLKPRITKMV